MIITYDRLRKYALLYAMLPLLIFALGWLRPIWSITLMIVLIVVFILAFVSKDGKKIHFDMHFGENRVLTDNKMVISVGVFIVLVLIAVVFVWLSGIGGLWAQSKDFPWRNAVFRDLILKDWPVYYPKYGGALSYYIGFWLPAACIGKLFLACGAGEELAFNAGNIALMLWTILGMVLLFLLIGTYLSLQSKKRIVFAVLFFVFFSGMDILGSIEPLGANLYHLEWWSDEYQYSSFTTCLFWVFNQAVISWIMTMCILQEKTVQNYVFIGMLCLFSGPLPFMGLFLYCLANGCVKSIHLLKKHRVKEMVVSIFSVSNILSAFTIFPIIGSFLLSNDAISGTGSLHVSSESVNMATKGEMHSIGETLLQYAMFVLVEFLLYAILIFRKNMKNYLFYVTVIGLLVFPFVRIGNWGDFAMRASIPALLVMYLMCTRFLCEEKTLVLREKGTKRLLYFVLTASLLLGCATPMVEFYRGFRQVALYGLDYEMEDYIGSFDCEQLQVDEDNFNNPYVNFVTTAPEQQTFYRVFAGEEK